MSRLLRFGAYQAPVEPFESGSTAALDRPQGDADPAGDLALGEPFEVREGQYFPVLLGDQRERPGYIPAIHTALGLWATGHVSKRLLSDRDRPYPPPPVEVHSPVARDPIQPGRKTRPPGVERSRRPPDTREGVLDQLLGQGSIPKHPDACGVYRPRVAVVQLRERPVIPFRYPAYQLFVPHDSHYGSKHLPPPGSTVPFTASWPVTLRYVRTDAARWFVPGSLYDLSRTLLPVVSLGAPVREGRELLAKAIEVIQVEDSERIPVAVGTL